MPDQEKPQFESPVPTRTQRLAMRAGGLLLGAGRRAEPQDIMAKLAVDVGGFKQESSAQGDAIFVHPGIEQKPVAAAQDETTRSSTVMAYANSRDFSAANGIPATEAARYTVGQETNTGPRAGTINSFIAGQLVSHAISGVGPDAHLKK